MNFLKFNLKDYPGAYAFQKCLGLKHNDSVLILADKKTDERSLKIISNSCRRMTPYVEALRDLPLKFQDEFPDKYFSAIKKNDAIILVASQSWYHSELRKIAKHSWKKRIVEAYDLNLSMLRKGGLCADYERVNNLTKKIALYFKNGQKINIYTNKGTDMTAKIINIYFETGFYQKQGSGGNLPAGEISLAIGDINGEAVIDSSCDIIGSLKKTNVNLHLKNGCVQKVSGKGKNKMESVFKRDKRLKNVVEIGIGTNSDCLFNGNVLEEEKRYGTMHLGFGNNTYFGGRIKGPHYDAVLQDPTIEIDKRVIMFKGRLINSV